MTTTSSTATKPLPPLLKVRDVAKILSLSMASVKSLIQSGELQGARVSAKRRKKLQRTHLRITSSSVTKFYEDRFNQKLDQALKNPFQN